MPTRRVILLASIAAACGENANGTSSAEAPQSAAQLTPTNEPGVSELLPPNQNPLQANVVSDPLVRQAIAVFDQGGSEKRWYNRIDQLDGLTIGFGHWPQGRFGTFLSSLRAHNNGATYAAFVARLSEYYTANSTALARAPHPVASSRPADVAAMLEQTLYSREFMSRYAENCERDERYRCLATSPSFYRENCTGDRDWIGSALEYALRDATVVRWQVDFWSSDVIDGVRDEAAAIGLNDDAGIIVLAHMNSSSPAYVRSFVSKTRTGVVTEGGVSWDWNTPGGGAPAAALTSWRKLVAWQFYNIRHERIARGRIRQRARNYFSMFLANEWRLPHMTGTEPVERALRENSDPTQVRWIAAN